MVLRNLVHPGHVEQPQGLGTVGTLGALAALGTLGTLGTLAALGTLATLAPWHELVKNANGVS